MKIFMLVAEDPFYILPFVKLFLKKYKNDIIGCGIPSGMISKRRIIATFLIYGPIKFLNIVCKILFYGINGGRVRGFLLSQGVLVKSNIDVNDPKFIDYLRARNVDLIVSNGCSQLLGDEILSVPSKGVINLHLGKLPAYRGVLPVFQAFVREEKSIGVTVHYMDLEFDSGSIISQIEIPIEIGDDLFSLYVKAFTAGAELLIDAVKNIYVDDIVTTPNGPDGKSYFSYPTFSQIRKYHVLTRKNKINL
jgi:methionyl-tRNA formyltransferase